MYDVYLRFCVWLRCVFLLNSCSSILAFLCWNVFDPVICWNEKKTEVTSIYSVALCGIMLRNIDVKLHFVAIAPSLEDWNFDQLINVCMCLSSLPCRSSEPYFGAVSCGE
jgi:hypothetical protein